MSVARKFGKELEKALDALASDEWAVAEARELAAQSLTPSEAFESVAPVLSLACEQSDSYAFSACCWLAMDLATLSSTTERPFGLEKVINEAESVAQRLGCERELAPLRKWYRYGT
mgnify:FL=1